LWCLCAIFRASFTDHPNIALVKYWGKRKESNSSDPSVSFTLNNCKTITKLAFAKENDGSFSFDLLLKGILKKISNRKFKSFRANRNLFAV
jgi:diphosphomevalonate decarboxylase